MSQRTLCDYAIAGLRALPVYGLANARDARLRSGGHVRIVRALIVALAAGLVALAMANASSAALHGSGLRTVLRGLDNPRGLAFLPDGQLAVAEGGHGGSLCLSPNQCGGLTGRLVAVNLASGREVAPFAVELR